MQVAGFAGRDPMIYWGRRRHLGRARRRIVSGTFASARA